VRETVDSAALDRSSPCSTTSLHGPVDSVTGSIGSKGVRPPATDLLGAAASGSRRQTAMRRMRRPRPRRRSAGPGVGDVLEEEREPFALRQSSNCSRTNGISSVYLLISRLPGRADPACPARRGYCGDRRRDTRLGHCAVSSSTGEERPHRRRHSLTLADERG